ncbi:hypothetical protein FALBO_6007 [Fusarium albosuccineum]|uniref:F-box domain-containing protein n=1 Tax=Fusarium albosuccineum TaxID=1237068 RepID=A0A8H4LFM5_9HYPO|nr:hypothetical protein FALBO_6007 [Fusarium albosuccineum]
MADTMEAAAPIFIMPPEVWAMIGKLLDHRSVDAATKASKQMRTQLIPRRFHEVRFDDTQRHLAQSLGAFLCSHGDLGKDQIQKAVRIATIVVDGRKEPIDGQTAIHGPGKADFIDKELPSLIVNSLSKMRNLRVLDLDVVCFSDQQTHDFIRLLSHAPHWSRVNMLIFNGPERLLTATVRHCGYENITALHLSQWFGTQEYDVARACPNLEKLRLYYDSLEVTAAGCWPSLEPLLLESVTEDFKGLKWLILSEKELPITGMLNAENWEQKLLRNTLQFAARVGTFDRIERVALTLRHRRFGPIVTEIAADHDIHSTEHPDYEYHIHDWYRKQIERLARHSESLREVCILDDWPVVYRGTRPNRDAPMVIQRGDLSENVPSSTFPVGLVG